MYTNYKGYCSPPANSEIRYILGVPGKRNLLVVGLNPNTANEHMLDGTSRNVQRLAAGNGFDGWFLVNLYPLRCPRPQELPKTANRALLNQNLLEIDQLVRDRDLRDIVLSWGNGVSLRTYLQTSARAIAELVLEHQLQAYYYRKNRTGHPSHLSPRNVNRFFRPADRLPLVPQVG